MPKVSIIVPIYNTEKYLRECINSLINQTLKDIEIIFINDCSPDNCFDIIKEYKDKRIKIINHKKNMGIGRSRNDGIKLATGEFIGFVDSDDYIDLDMYEKYYNFAVKNKVDIVTGHYKKVFDNKVKIFQNNYFEITNKNTNKNIINLIDYGPCNKIFRSKVIKSNSIEFDEKLKFEDVPFVLGALYYSNNVGHLNKALYNYRIRDNSETTTVDNRTEDIFEILKIINKKYKYNDEIEYFNITQITRYMLKQKHQKDKLFKKEFINKGFSYLNSKFPNWKNNKYYKKENIIKRTIKSNKKLLNMYIKMMIYFLIVL